MTFDERMRARREEYLRLEALGRTTLAELADAYMDAAIWAMKGNLVQAAKLLGVSRQMLYRRGKRGERQQ